jgi:hypothetical protein
VSPDSLLAAGLGRILARPEAGVRCGPDAGDEFLVRNDPDIQAAMGYWDRLGSLRGGTARQ